LKRCRCPLTFRPRSNAADLTAAATWLVLAAIIALAPGTSASEPDPVDEPVPTDRPAGADLRDPVPVLAGRLAWLSADGLDLVADLEGEIPFLVRGTEDFWFDFGLRTAIEDTTSNLDFVVRDIDYFGDIGWRTRGFARGPGALSLFVGQRGKALVDVPGDAWVRYFAVGLESRRYRQPVTTSPGVDLQWRIAAGPVLDDRGIDADLYLRGNARLRFASGRPKGPRRAFAFDLRLDGLVEGGSLNADITFGPGFEIPTDDGRRILLFAHYQISENPLGIGEDAWLVGLEYAEGLRGSDEVSSSRSGGDLSGSIAWGAGSDERIAGQLFMRFLTPEFGRRMRFAVDVDANVLTSEDVDDLYWRYDVGLERVRRSTALGVYLYHRSNHRLSQTGSGFTSRNVIELGVETHTWTHAGRRPTRRGAKFDYRLRVGYLANSTFDEDPRWNLRAGVRWSLPIPHFGSTVPFVLYELEHGDIESSTLAFGVSPSRALDFQIEFRHDEQYFASDQRATLVTARYGF